MGLAMADIETYISRMTELYAEHGLSFSVHRKTLFADGHIAFPGSAFKDAREAAQNAMFWSGKGHDVYLAMGGENEVGASDKPRKYPPAIRKLYNVGACTALYLDIDVKEKAYPTQRDALSALKGFLVKYDLSMPSFMVSSGTGGIHVYWLADELFSPVEHNSFSQSLVNMAHEYGLKIDPECTKDLCRLLRLPDTWNFKTNPANPVKLLHSGSKISLAKLRQQFKVSNVVPIVRGLSPTPAADDNDDLLRQKKQYAPADMALAATLCEFLHNTLLTGGRTHSEAIWKQTVTLASYCEDGRNVAHKLSSGHPAYTPEETDLKFDQVEIDRRNNPRLGPSHCSALKQIGVTECATCAYFELGTTPLNVPNFTSAPKFIPSHNPNSDLPEGYYRDEHSTVWTDCTDITSGEVKPVQVFPYTMVYNSAFAESGAQEYSFVFTSVEGDGHTKIVKLPMAASSNKDALATAMARNGMPMLITDPIRKFFVAFQALLRNHDDTLVTTSPIGWHMLPDGTMGFAFNGNHYSKSKDGKTKIVKAQRLDSEMARSYSVVGDGKPWIDLSNAIIAQGRQDINLIIACGFAAPLMTLTGHAGVAVGAWSGSSGIGKSTALALCQGIWGSTVRMQGLDDTVNQVMDTMATLKNMPLCWDDIKGNAQTERMAQLIFMVTRGREKGRLMRNAKQAQQRDFEALLTWTANNPMLDEIARATRGTSAGHYRVMEFQCDETFVTQLNVGKMTELTGLLRKNYGHIGQKYAEYIGVNYTAVNTFVNKMREKIEDDLQTNQSERFWVSAAAALIVGARLANGLKFTNFDLSAFEAFVYDLIRKLRGGVKDSVMTDMSRISDVELMLGEFLQSMSLMTLKTDTMKTTPGRPAKGTIKVLNDNIAFSRQVMNVQISKAELLCRISDPAIGEFCKKQGLTKSVFTSSLQKHFKAISARGRIGSGTEYASPPFLIWELDLKGTALGNEIEF